MLPLALPAMSALVILQFQGTWNDFFWPLILFGQGDQTHYTIQLGLQTFYGQYTTDVPAVMVGSILAILPVLVIFLAFQRYFVSGVISSGVKG
jgi:ABC-type glycerol-3-phosphate transport system permease component